MPPGQILAYTPGGLVLNLGTEGRVAGEACSHPLAAVPPPTLREHLARSAAWGLLKAILEEAGRGEIPVSGETLLDLLEEVEEGK